MATQVRCWVPLNSPGAAKNDNLEMVIKSAGNPQRCNCFREQDYFLRYVSQYITLWIYTCLEIQMFLVWIGKALPVWRLDKSQRNVFQFFFWASVSGVSGGKYLIICFWFFRLTWDATEDASCICFLVLHWCDGCESWRLFSVFNASSAQSLPIAVRYRMSRHLKIYHGEFILMSARPLTDQRSMPSKDRRTSPHDTSQSMSQFVHVYIFRGPFLVKSSIFTVCDM